MNTTSKTRYDAIVEQAAGENPLPVRQPGQRGRLAKGPPRCLIDRLTAHRDEALLFLEDFRVPFANNRAEQSLRMAKVKGKMSGCMRTLSRADDFAAIMSFIASVKKHGIHVFSAIKKAFPGNAYGVLFPAPTE
ncbi:MAG: transposase [Oscillospiraceae bacterium]|nr:transposase [Oscillospiraceae bacterium]